MTTESKSYVAIWRKPAAERFRTSFIVSHVHIGVKPDVTTSKNEARTRSINEIKFLIYFSLRIRSHTAIVKFTETKGSERRSAQ